MQTYVQRKPEQKKKQFTIYSLVYVYIYIYIFLFKHTLCFLLFLNHYSLFYFSRVNLQLKVGAKDEKVLGTLVPVFFTRPEPVAKWKPQVITQTNCYESTDHADTFFNFPRVAGRSKSHTSWRSRRTDIWRLPSGVIVSSKPAEVDVPVSYWPHRLQWGIVVIWFSLIVMWHTQTIGGWHL